MFIKSAGFLKIMRNLTARKMTSSSKLDKK